VSPIGLFSSACFQSIETLHIALMDSAQMFAEAVGPFWIRPEQFHDVALITDAASREFEFQRKI
jgi:hypothetical protein